MADPMPTSPSISDTAKSIESVPRRGRLIGIDFGTKRVGLAVSDVEQKYAVALTMFPRSSSTGDANSLKRATEGQAPVGLVVGLPVHMSGDEGAKAKQAREFGIWSGRVLGLPVAFWDERHTSLIAEGYLTSAGVTEKKRKMKIDALAAQIMLQSFLDAADRTQWAPRPKRTNTTKGEFDV